MEEYELPFFLPVLRLEKMCLIKIMANLSNNQQLLGLIMECDFYPEFQDRLNTRQEKWKDVKKKAHEILLPVRRSAVPYKRMLEMLWSMSYRIILWMSKFSSFMKDQPPQCFYWTYRGEIDNVKTAQSIIRNKNICIKTRFQLACCFCLSDAIHEMWHEMAREIKDYFLTKKDKESPSPLTLFWSHILEESEEDYGSLMEEALTYAARTGLSDAVKYLLMMVHQDDTYYDMEDELERSCLLEFNDKLSGGAIPEEEDIVIAIFIVSNMSYTRNNRTIGSFITHYKLLSVLAFLHSSNKDFFLEVMNMHVEFCDENAGILLRMIFCMYQLEVLHDYNYHSLFIRLWRAFPVTVRCTVTTTMGVGTLCIGLMIKHDFPFVLEKEGMEKIDLKKLTLTDMERIASYKMPYFRQDKWEILVFIIEHLITLPSFMTKESSFLTLVGERTWRKATFERVLTFVRKIRALKGYYV